MSLFSRREQFSWVPYTPALHPGALSNAISCFVITSVSLDSSFIKAQLQALEGVPLPATGGDSSSLRLISWPVGVLIGQLACQWTRPSGRTWGPFVPGLLLMRTTVQSAPTGEERNFIDLSPFPSICLLSPSYPFRFSNPLVLDAGIWSKGLSLSWGLETDHLLLSKNSNSGRAEFQSSLLWKPRENSRNAWVSAGAGDVCKATPFAPLSCLLLLLFLSSS